jgi:hypothetical protein
MSNEIEFGTTLTISTDFKRRMLRDTFESIISENLIRDAHRQGYEQVSPVVISWNDKAYKYIGDEDNLERVQCDPDEKGAFYNVGARMKVIEKELS